MNMKKMILASLAVLALFNLSCTRRESKEDVINKVINVASDQTCMMYNAMDSVKFFRTLDKDGNYVYSKRGWWCSGFFPGTLWKMYEATGNQIFCDYATDITAMLDSLQYEPCTHDIGFQINCSYGNGYLLTKREQYRDMVIKGAEMLAARFDPVVGCTRSWNGEHYRVIIDNMMNLEILFNAASLGGDKGLCDIAVKHARTTMANHFRPDYSTWHVLDYDPETGNVLTKKTNQGYSDDSAWARGQAWGLYGYTMMYRFTKDPDFLAQAEHIADYIIGRLPEDYIPFWDYDAPDIPNTVRDASAAAIQASALLELSGYASGTRSKKYLKVAEETLRMLASPEYLAEPGTNGGFILKHSTGHKPKNSEVDVPLNYADYYFIEAILRWRAMK